MSTAAFEFSLMPCQYAEDPWKLEPVKLKTPAVAIDLLKSLPPPGLGDGPGFAETTAAETAHSMLHHTEQGIDLPALPSVGPPPGLGFGPDAVPHCMPTTCSAPALRDPFMAMMLEKEALAYENRILQERAAFAEQSAAVAARFAEHSALLQAQCEYVQLASGAIRGGAVSGDACGTLPSYAPDPSLYWQMQLAPAQQPQSSLHQQSISAVSPSQRWMLKKSGARSMQNNTMSKVKTCGSFGPSLSASPTASTTDSFATSSEDSDDNKEHGKRNVPLTTVMMRNIPNSFSRKKLLDLIDDQGFRNCYDLFYLPMDFKTKNGLGYAFINLVSTEDAGRFWQRFNGFSSWPVQSSKICVVSWSDVYQGVRDNIERYRNSPVMHASVPDDFKPVLFRNGNRVPFPAPTKKIAAPPKQA